MRLHLHRWGSDGSPPLVCVHGISAHGRRFRRLAEERWSDRYRVLAPDLRGHGSSSHDPPWDIPTHLDDLLETIDAERVGPSAWIGHSFGGRLVAELAARAPERITRAALLDPALELLPHVAHDFAEDARLDVTFASVDEAVDARGANAATTPREDLEEDAREQLIPTRDGRLRCRYCRSAVVTGYSEMTTAPPRPATLSMPTLLLYAPSFGLVREEQVEAYRAVPTVEVVAVPGGHVVYWDAYRETADALDRFLDSEDPGP
jgi:lipase